jgi:thioredoxin reductase (NADPH)
MESYDIVIIGAGIAGMTAAIYAKRAGKNVLILEQKTHGGQILNSTSIANWPGEIRISGPELSEKIYHQVNNLGINILYETVLSINNAGNQFTIKTDESEYSSSTIIIAVGSSEKELGVSGEKELTGKGVSYCATCDGAFYKDKTVAVIGGGNTALYDALYLSDIAKKVYLIHRRDEFRGDEILVEKLQSKDNIETLLGWNVTKIEGDQSVNRIEIKSTTNNVKTIDLDGVFVAIGRAPKTELFRNLVDIDENGYITAGEDCHTSKDGIFVAGDCRTKNLRQLITAASDGATAATEAVKFLR